jgi:hypothetical protein
MMTEKNIVKFLSSDTNRRLTLDGKWDAVHLDSDGAVFVVNFTGT